MGVAVTHRLHAARLDRRYGSFHEVHGIPGSCEIIAASFSAMVMEHQPLPHRDRPDRRKRLVPTSGGQVGGPPLLTPATDTNGADAAVLPCRQIMAARSLASRPGSSQASRPSPLTGRADPSGKRRPSWAGCLGIYGSRSCHRGSSMSAQAASHKVLTVTRMLLRAEGTGGQNQKLPLPSSPGKPCQSPGMPSCSFPASSTART